MRQCRAALTRPRPSSACAPPDADAYRALRLEGLTTDPAAFGSTYPEEAARPAAWFAERLEARAMFGALLVRAVLDHAAGVVEQVQLTVAVENMAARRLYARLGFVEWGVEPRALKQDARYFDEAWMVKLFTP